MDKEENLVSRSVRVQWVLLLLLAGVPWFFFGGPGAYGSRSFVALWDLGHVLFFLLTSWLLCKTFRYRFQEASAVTVQGGVFLIVLVSGIVVEGLQMCFDGRSPDVHDILRNQLGSLIALAFFDSGTMRLKRWGAALFRGAVVILLVVASYPLARAVVDECIALSQFPLLSDFATPFEADRWKDEKLVSVQDDIARHGNHSLKVELTTDTYSGVSLCHFPGNWKGFEYLSISVFLPEEEPLKLVCRIHDSEHNNEYADRFNRSFVLENGWNDLVIPLNDVQTAPVDRLMKMDRIENITLFVTRQDKGRVIYIDYVFLR
ncbi:MAG: hypothetical protein JKY62_12175 [Desulfocapsa sp.]|nr:hypothetical protein [Desulfocapsa sp.]MBL4903389.1 hypothetical protein [Desulfocapsa sp.]